MTFASTFSGIGGEMVAAKMMGWDVKFHCEINPFCRRVLEYWFPESISYEDITKTDFSEWRGKIDVLTGGFPCQPFSYAGRRGGAQDDRYLWPYMFGCIGKVQPTWVIAENVAGVTTMVEQGDAVKVADEVSMFEEDNHFSRYEYRQTFTIERICSDLEQRGYSVQPVLIPACAVGAPHRRDRVFIIAHRESAVSEDAMCGGQLHGHYEESGRERDERHTGAGSSERLCRETQGSASDASDPGAEGLRREREDSVCGSGSAPDPDSMGRRGGRCPKSERRANNIPASILGEAERHGESQSTPDPRDERSQGDKHQGEQAPSGAAGRGGFDTAGRDRPDGQGQTLADPSDERLSQRLSGGECEDAEERATGVDDTTQRFGYDGPAWWHVEDGEVAGLGAWDNFPTVSPVHCGNDGLPFDVDCLTVPPIPKPPTYGKGNPKKYPFGKWRIESLKACGNAIVPELMYEIFRAI